MSDSRRHDILTRLLADQRSGALLGLEDYHRIFPDVTEIVTEEFQALAADLLPGAPVLRNYRLLKELGRGGQAIVYLAEDERLKRKVALKVLTVTSLSAERSLARFRREAQAASRLAHPNICPVFETGIEAGQAFIAMQRIEGETLASMLRRAEPGEVGSTYIRFHPASETELAKPESTRPSVDRARVALLLEKVALALHAAHEVGVVHRDVKPGNIIVDRDEEPIVVDFGLAGDLDHDGSALTLSGEIFGTPAYMAPEQIEPAGRGVDRRIDVWALGVVLYEALTGRRPFAAPTRDELMRRIREEEPPSPRQVEPTLPSPLDVIVSTALAKDPNRRYATAFDVAEDLRRFRSMEPLRARPSTWWERLHRWGRRNPAVALLLPAVTVILGVALLMTDQALRQAQEREATLLTMERDDAARRALDEAFRDYFDREKDRGAAEFRRLLDANVEPEWCRIGLDLAMGVPSTDWRDAEDAAVRRFHAAMRLLPKRPDEAVTSFYRAMEVSDRPRLAIHRGLLDAMQASGHPGALELSDSIARFWPSR